MRTGNRRFLVTISTTKVAGLGANPIDSSERVFGKNNWSRFALPVKIEQAAQDAPFHKLLQPGFSRAMRKTKTLLQMGRQFNARAVCAQPAKRLGSHIIQTMPNVKFGVIGKRLLPAKNQSKVVRYDKTFQNTPRR